MQISSQRRLDFSMTEVRNCCDYDAQPGIVVVRVPLEAGMGAAAVPFFVKLQDILGNSDGLRALVDFQAVDVVESSVLAELVALHRRIADQRGLVCFFGFAPVIRQSLRQTLLDSLLLIRDDVSSATAALDGS
jgi:anti-anti-sigma regulatory factor